MPGLYIDLEDKFIEKMNLNALGKTLRIGHTISKSANPTIRWMPFSPKLPNVEYDVYL